MGTRAKSPGRPAGRGAVVVLTDRRPPPKIHSEGLTVDQQRGLAEHLTRELDAPDAARLFYAIEHWFHFGPSAATLEARIRWAAARRHYEQLAALARALRDELNDLHWETAPDGDLLTRVLEDVERSSFEGALERLGRVGAGLSEPRDRKRRRGAPPVEWRDALIALVHAHYPEDRRAVAQFSHFEDTIALLLGYLGAEIENLHKQIVRTLKRKPRSPLLLRLEEPASLEPRAHLPWSAGYRRT